MSKIRADLFQKDRLRGLQKVKTDIWKFVKEWNACLEDKQRDVTLLFSYLKPEIDNWVFMFTDPRYPKNINYAILWSLVDYGDPYEIFTAWAEENEDELESIFIDIFLDLLRHPPFTITVRPKQYIFVLTRLFIYKLGHKIRGWYNKHIKEIDYKEYYSETTYELNTEFTHAMIDIERAGPYWYYLINLYISDYESDDFLRVTKTTSSLEYLRRTMYEWKNQKRTTER